VLLRSACWRSRPPSSSAAAKAAAPALAAVDQVKKKSAGAAVQRLGPDSARRLAREESRKEWLTRPGSPNSAALTVGRSPGRSARFSDLRGHRRRHHRRRSAKPTSSSSRPAPNPRLRAAIIAADVIIDRPTARAPSSPRTGNHEKGIGDGGSSRSVGIAPPSLARAREGREYGQRGSVSACGIWRSLSMTP
jgi:hypothetical protein